MNRLDDAYRATTYWVEHPDGYVALRIGEANPDLDALLDRLNVREWAIVTACNPGSRLCTPAENAERQETLSQEVCCRWYSFDGLGVGAGGDWPPEPSRMILDISRADALALAAAHGQRAIVAGTRGGYPKLVYCSQAHPG
jgi:hypothetical protein